MKIESEPHLLKTEPSPLRRAAAEFEALLLSHFTAALNPSDGAGEAEEDGLFSSSATSLYRQMFSEQIAKTMAQSGGIGLADVLTRQFGASPADNSAQRAIDMARLVRREGDVTDPAASMADPGLNAPPIEKRPRPANAATFDSTSPAHPTRPGSTRSAGGIEVEMRQPLEGRISSHFGNRRDPIHGRRRYHAGVDIAAPQGARISAAAPGTVVFAGRRGGYGNMVEIEHADGRRTRYGHADHLLVSTGDQVSDGQPIATVGSTGRATGPHLHFEVVENGAKVDPLRALAKDVTLTRR